MILLEFVQETFIVLGYMMFVSLRVVSKERQVVIVSLLVMGRRDLPTLVLEIRAFVQRVRHMFVQNFAGFGLGGADGPQMHVRLEDSVRADFAVLDHRITVLVLDLTVQEIQ